MQNQMQVIKVYKNFVGYLHFYQIYEKMDTEFWLISVKLLTYANARGPLGAYRTISRTILSLFSRGLSVRPSIPSLKTFKAVMIKL